MIYFDQSATSLWKPEGVAKAMEKALRTGGNAGRGAHGASLTSGRMDYAVRKQVSRFLGAPDPYHVIFTSGATESLNIALFGLLKPGDHVVTTSLEHNSVLRPLYELERRGVGVSIAPLRSEGDVQAATDAICALVRPDTRLVAVTHASNVLGTVHDIRALGRFCAERGILLAVDASQTAGLLPIDVKDMGISCLCCSAHKSLLGPQGVGLLVLGQGIRPTPFLLGGTGSDSFSKSMPDAMPARYEAGTLNTPGIAGLGAGIDYIEEHGIDNLYTQAMDRARLFHEGVCGIPGLKLYGDFSREQTHVTHIPVVSLNVGDRQSGEVADSLWQEAEIAVRPGAHCAPLVHESRGTAAQGMVRFSFSHKNTEWEVSQAVSVLQELARRDRSNGN